MPLAGRGLFHHQSLTVNLPVTVGMKQYQIADQLVTTQDAPEQVVDVPALLQRQGRMADQAFPVLLQPKVSRPRTARQGVGHPSRQTLLEVQLPGRVIRIRSTFNFHVPADGRGPRADEINSADTALFVPHLAAKPPTAVARLREVMGLDPRPRLVPMPPPCPTPELPKDHIIDAREGSSTRCVPVIECPTANLRVEPLDQLSGCEVSTLML